VVLHVVGDELDRSYLSWVYRSLALAEDNCRLEVSCGLCLRSRTVVALLKSLLEVVDLCVLSGEVLLVLLVLACESSVLLAEAVNLSVESVNLCLVATRSNCESIVFLALATFSSFSFFIFSLLISYSFKYAE
jgi:hypothetical protein